MSIQSTIAVGVLALGIVVMGCAGSRGVPYGTPDAQTEGGTLPDGTFPDGCSPQCTGKNCGDSDGCGGACQTGNCTTGQRCVAGVCTCDGDSCPKGCCQEKLCFPGTADDHCGAGGQACVDCLLVSQSCGSSQACINCQPECAGKACGDPNGCGGTCSTGTCPSGQTCSGGSCICTAQSCPSGCCDPNQVCQPGTTDGACGTTGGLCQDCGAQSKICASGSCKACDRWETQLQGLVRDLEVDSDGTIYAAGASGDKIFVASLDSCGTVTKSTSHLPSGYSKASASGLALTGNNLYVGGWIAPTSGDPLQGLMGRFSKPGLAVSWTASLFGSTGKDEVWDIVHAGGALWMNGTSDFEGTPTVWGVKGTTTKAACGFSWLAGGYGRGIDAPAGSGYVYFTGTSAGKGFVARQSETACTVSPCGSCKAPWSITFQDGTNSTEGRALLVSGGSVYVAGFSSLGSGDYQGAVFHLDLATGNVLHSYTYNPTAKGELFLSLATDGTSLYVSGTQNYVSPVTSSVQAVVLKLTMPTLTLQWAKTPDPGGYWSVEVVGQDGLLLGGDATGGTGLVRRCLRSGTCP